MTREVVIERTARILKQADPDVIPPPPRVISAPTLDGPPTIVIAIIAGIIAFVAMIVAITQ